MPVWNMFRLALCNKLILFGIRSELEKSLKMLVLNLKNSRPLKTDELLKSTILKNPTC